MNQNSKILNQKQFNNQCTQEVCLPCSCTVGVCLSVQRGFLVWVVEPSKGWPGLSKVNSKCFIQSRSLVPFSGSFTFHMSPKKGGALNYKQRGIEMP